MTFSQTLNARISKRWDGSKFVEEDLTLTGTNGISVTVTSGGYEIDGSGVTLSVKDDDALVSSSASIFDFGLALDVTDQGSGEMLIAVDESEFLNTMFLTGNQTVSGEKTFEDNIVIQGDLTVNGTTTTINTEELLIEDNCLTLSYTVTGSPTEDACLEVERGDDPNAQLYWNESSDEWEIGISGSLEKVIVQSDLDAQNLIVEDDGVQIDDNVLTLDFGAALDATLSGSSEIRIDVDESEFTTVVFLTGAQSIGGAKTFEDGIVLDTADITNSTSGVNDLGSASSTFAELHVDQGFNYNAPTLDDHIVNKAYVDAQVANADITVKDNDSVISSGVGILDFGFALDVTDQGSGEMQIAVDESEFTTVLFLAGAQTATGKKTFSAGLAVASGVEPADTSDTQGGVEGEIRWGDDYLYVNVDGTNWKRTALASF